MTPLRGEITSTKPRWKRLFVFFSFIWFVYVAMCFSPGPTQYIFYTPVARYSLFVLKVPLNTNKPNQIKLQETV